MKLVLLTFDDGVPVSVNRDNITHLTPDGDYTKIHLTSGQHITVIYDLITTATILNRTSEPHEDTTR